MNLYPYNGKMGQTIQSDALTVTPDKGFIANLAWSATEAVVANTTAIHAAITTSGSTVTTVTTEFTNPSCAKSITATAGGTAANIKAVSVTVVGTDINDAVITAVLPTFTVDTAGTVESLAAFKTITSVSIPAMDGAGVTVSIGKGEKLGLPYLLDRNTLLKAFHNKAIDATPTVTVSGTVLSLNTIDFTTSLDGTVAEASFIV